MVFCAVVSLLNAIKAHQRGQEEVAAVATTKQKSEWRSAHVAWLQDGG